jgi:hypothetical protein
MIGKKTLIEGGVKLGFAGDKGLAEIKLHILAAKGYGKLIPDNRFGPGFGKIRARESFLLILALFLRLGLQLGLGPRLGGRNGFGFLRRNGTGFPGRNNFGNCFTGGEGKQNRPYQEF